jgi:uncharacterized protein with FMN-binding domain
MRRIVTVFLSTITMLVLLFSYHTSTNSGVVATSPFVQQPASSGSGAQSGQVEITVQGGKITQSRAVQYPQNNNRDVSINNYALPILDQEAVQQQSASIDTISGATVTSDGYLQSLQSAIDQAHL